VVLAVKHLTKEFGSFRAVDDVSFIVEEGEIVGLLGPNGAGKSTILHMLLGLILPTSGTIRVFGKDIHRHREAVFGSVNIASPYTGFPNRLTVLENLLVYARLYGVSDRRRRIRELLRRLAINDLENKPVARLSSGETACVRLCKALLNNPRLLFLDEATGGLDPHRANRAKQVLLDMRRDSGMAILCTSHNLAEVEELCGRVLLLKRGCIISSGTPSEVTRDILREDRGGPALKEVFIRISEKQPHEAA
jgi:ABC-2 type transport system ATP-binding protein